MSGYILRRLAQLLPVLLIASFGIWAMVYAVPGSPIGAIVGENATPEQIQAAIERLGLDKPFLVQYWTWLKGALTKPERECYVYPTGNENPRMPWKRPGE